MYLVMSARLLEIGQFCILLPFCEPRFDLSALLHEVRISIQKAYAVIL